ncbi:unnamed protein product [Symbiodinium natans]|uniref:Uncharacterized protein n=1 Tax=Symbiodinium natans TaxID=878477 RepID=A0A812I6A7_9DINO|nr:unnamed protein product [Symbiodinium natans]
MAASPEFFLQALQLQQLQALQALQGGFPLTATPGVTDAASALNPAALATLPGALPLAVPAPVSAQDPLALAATPLGKVVVVLW